MDLDYHTARLLQREFQQEFSPGRENIDDSFIARQLQEQFEKEIVIQNSQNNGKYNHKAIMSDSLLAQSLQEQFEQEHAIDKPRDNLVYDKKNKSKVDTKSLVDPSWEVIDPTPDIHVLFMAFNSKFFWGKLDIVCVSWSKKMKRCAGICSYQGRGGMCSITLSEPLLKLRPRKDLIETLLHEMIHAFLFVTNNNKDRDGHGPEFHKHMYRINNEAGTNITVYHDFHDEVELYLQHWWRCDGMCQKWKPYFGIVRRSVNRAPGPNDRWWGEHSRNCGGTFNKIKSPEPKVKETKKGKENKPVNDIRKYLGSTDPLTKSKDKVTISGSPKPCCKSGNSNFNSVSRPNSSSVNTISNIHTISKPSSGLSTKVTIPSSTNNIHGFSNSTNKTCGGQKGAIRNASNTIVVNKKPCTVTSEQSNVPKPCTSNSGSFTSNKKYEINDGIPANYEVVRNHWVNKFSNSQTSKNRSKSASDNISNKRSLNENNDMERLKIIKRSDSENSLDIEKVPCPVCNVLYAIDELNTHLDVCLSNPTSKNRKKECIVCLQEVEESMYQRHVNECVSNNFDDAGAEEIDSGDDNDVIFLEDDSMDVDSVKCKVCENNIVLSELNEHLKICGNRNECPECKEKIDPDMYDTHLASCLLKNFDEIDRRFNTKVENGESETSTTDEMIDCLACGKNIPKLELNSHLDDCLNSMFKEEMSVKNLVESDDKLYNCPFCLKLVSEIEMNDHINICVTTLDGDIE